MARQTRSAPLKVEEHFVLYENHKPYLGRYDSNTKVYFSLKSARSAKTRIKNRLVQETYSYSDPAETRNAKKKAKEIELESSLKIVKYLPSCVERA